MQILFAISILSFLVLLWAAMAITRRVRLTHKRENSSARSQSDFSQHLFVAAEGSNTSSSHLAHHQPSKDTKSAKSWNISAMPQTSADSHDKATSPKRD